MSRPLRPDDAPRPVGRSRPVGPAYPVDALRPVGPARPHRRTPARRTLLAAGALLPAGLLAACADPVPVTGSAGAAGASDAGGTGGEGGIDTSGTQERIRSTVDPALADAVPEAIRADGRLTVGSLTGGTPPLVFLADDNRTTIGSEIDVAQLVADKLGLELDLQLTSWDSWPLKLQAGEYEVVHANVGINAERLRTFDFASYRAAYMTFLVRSGGDIELEDPASISGHRIAVTAGTNQERILVAWNQQNAEAGAEPAELKNYSSDADVLLALGAGRIDAYFAPFATMSYVAATRPEVRTSGRVDAGWPEATLVSATFPRGSGLAAPYSAALNAVIAEGTYARVLERWHLTEEALEASTVHTEENP